MFLLKSLDEKNHEVLMLTKSGIKRWYHDYQWLLDTFSLCWYPRHLCNLVGFDYISQWERLSPTVKVSALIEEAYLMNGFKLGLMYLIVLKHMYVQWCSSRVKVDEASRSSTFCERCGLECSSRKRKS